jgi:hypothetical protein
MDGLVDEVGEGDHGERKSAEEVVGACRKQGRSNVPHEQNGNAGERDGSQEDRDGAVGSIKTGVHGAGSSGALGGYPPGGGIYLSGSI